MEFRKVLALRGPNIWANSPVIEAWVDLKDLDRPSTDFPGFSDRLMSWLPTMIEHRCSIGERGGFFQRLRDGTYPGHILEHVTLELQSLVGREVGFGRARETSEPGVYRVVVKYNDEQLARECLHAARELVLAAIHDRPYDVKAEIERLRDFAHEICLGPSTSAIVDAAKARGIPVRRLNAESMVQFGYGAKLRRIQAAETDRTGAIAETIAQDKELTRTLLKAVGVPVARRPAGDRCGRRLGGCLRHRRAGGRQAPRRQSGPRRGHQPHHPRADPGRLPGRLGREQASGRGEVRPGTRLSPAGRGRQGRGRRPPRAGPGAGRRRAHDSRTGRRWSISTRAAASITPPC